MNTLFFILTVNTVTIRDGHDTEELRYRLWAGALLIDDLAQLSLSVSA